MFLYMNASAPPLFMLLAKECLSWVLLRHDAALLAMRLSCRRLVPEPPSCSRHQLHNINPRRSHHSLLDVSCWISMPAIMPGYATQLLAITHNIKQCWSLQGANLTSCKPKGATPGKLHIHKWYTNPPRNLVLPAQS